MTRTTAAGAALLLLLARDSRADSGRARMIARADSAYAAGDPDSARSLYESVVRADGSQSHAVFRLAQLTADRARAVQLYRRYAALEPTDAWGAMALGDALSRIGRTRDALAQYDRAASAAPEERDVAAGRAQVLVRAGRVDAAAATLERWLARHPEDGELWQQLARRSLESGRPGHALRAFAQAEAAGRDDGPAASAQQLARALQSPAVEPLMAQSRDSDGNRTATRGLTADLMSMDGTRLGVRLSHSDISGVGASATVSDAQLWLTARPRSAWRVDAGAGSERLAIAGRASTSAAGDFRARWQAPRRGPGIDVRAERRPLTSNAELIAGGVARTQARGTLDLPAGRLRVRGSVDGARVEANGQTNLRRGLGLGLALPVADPWTPWLRYERWGYRDQSTAGYFAPRRAEGVALGSTLDLGAGEPWTLELDGGLGPQRFAAAGRPADSWRPGASAYGYASVRLGPGRELRLELELEDSPGFVERLGSGADWRYSSVTVSVHWSLR